MRDLPSGGCFASCSRLLVMALALAQVSRAVPWLASGPSAPPGPQRVANPGLETTVGGLAEGFTGWDAGYVLDDQVRRSGQRSARCTVADPAQEYGVGQTVVLDQTTPTAFVARAWSRAENISGAPDAHYSLYLDLEYTDGTPLWGQIAAFSTGTHDWEQAKVLVLPAKPVKSVRVLGLLRQHTGTAWFDDFELYELAGTAQFDLLPVAGELPKAQGADWLRRDLGNGLELLVDRGSGAMTCDPTRLGGLVLRDAGDESGLVLAPLTLREDGADLVLSGAAAELGLAVEARLHFGEASVQLDMDLRDTTGRDRAISAYWALPLPPGNWLWCRDARHSEPLNSQSTAGSFRNLGAGANGQASWYPFTALAQDQSGLAIGAPLAVPRLARFACDGPRRVLYAAFDLGLSPATRKFPSQATCSTLLFTFPAEWRFRAALQRYYQLNPEAFVRRVRRQGLWMPFLDIAAVRGWEDFGFQYQEGAPNPAFDEAHGIDSFPYIEPMSHWLPLGAEVPRETAAALRRLDELAVQGDPQALATRSSALHGPDGNPTMGFHDAPWCDGALFLLNPDPDLASGETAPVTQYTMHRRTIDRVLEETLTLPAWTRYGDGFVAVERDGRGGSRGVRVQRSPETAPMGLSQTVVLAQTEAREIVAKAWSRAAAVTGTPAGNYCLYLDLTYTDGTHLWGQAAAFSPGTHDWQEVSVRITPAQPVHTVVLHLLFRGEALGTAWFDDASLSEAGSEANRLQDGGFEAAPERVVIDGLYLDSFEMAGTLLNYRREHFASADLPLVFDSRARVCQLGHFLAMELLRDLARELHPRARLVFANAVLHLFPWPAANLDILGTETNWNPDGHWTPDSEERMLYWRALCGKRPYVTLQNTDFDQFPPELVERYLARCGAYGVLPSFFSPDAANGVYWTRAELYDRDRPLFKRYIPVIRQVAEAGWEPIHFASSTNPELWVERFGAGNEIFLTAFNPGSEVASADIALDLDRLTEGRRAVAEVLLPEARALGEVRAPYRWTVSLPPERLAVLRLSCR